MLIKEIIFWSKPGQGWCKPSCICSSSLMLANVHNCASIVTRTVFSYLLCPILAFFPYSFCYNPGLERTVKRMSHDFLYHLLILYLVSVQLWFWKSKHALITCTNTTILASVFVQFLKYKYTSSVCNTVNFNLLIWARRFDSPNLLFFTAKGGQMLV